jgi:MFS family permease
VKKGEKKMQTSSYSTGQGIVLGALSGIVGAIFVFLMLARFLPPVTGIHTYFSIASFRSVLMYTGSAVTLSVAARMLLGLVVGGIFGAVALRQSVYHRGAGRVVGLGVIAGLVAWFVLSFLGIILYDVMSHVTMAYSGALGYYLAYSFVAYLIFGIVMGALTGFLLPRYTVRTVVQSQPMTVTQEVQRS